MLAGPMCSYLGDSYRTFTVTIRCKENTPEMLRPTWIKCVNLIYFLQENPRFLCQEQANATLETRALCGRYVKDRRQVSKVQKIVIYVANFLKYLD